MDASLIFRNTVANFLGKLTNRAIRILLVPLQINILGEEAFGLLGLYALVGSLLAVLDFGLTITANREVARLAVNGERVMLDIRDLVRTFEVPYWLVGVLAGGGILLSAGWITDNWIIAPTLPRETVLFSVAIIGLLFVAHWPVSLYNGVLYGLQRQVEANVLAISVEMLNGIGSVAVLLLYPKIETFFLWQMIVGMVEIIGFVGLCWGVVRRKGLPSPKFRLTIFRQVWRYALGVNAISLFGTLFLRLDSLILSKLLPINFLGYYSIVQRVPSLIGLFSGSILPATTPRVVAYNEKQDWAHLSQVYHRQARWLAFLSVGIAFPLAAFAYPVLRLWTQSETVASATWLAFTLIVAVSALEDTSNSVNQLSLACGFTRPPVTLGIIEGLIVTIGTLILTPALGIAGAALSWTVARTIRYVLYPLWVHRLVLQGEARQWFLSDTLPILGIGGLCFGSGCAFYQFFGGDLLLWIPIALVTELFFLGFVLWFGLVPEWQSIPLLFVNQWRSINTKSVRGF